MKKILSVLLCAMFVLSFAACGEGEEKVKPIGIDVEYYAKIGQIPELEHKLGDDADEIISNFEEEHKNITDATSGSIDHDHTEGGYIGTYDNGEYTTIATTGINYFFDSNKKKDGINRIVSLNGGYGFSNGDLIIEVKKAMESYGHTADERAATEKEAQACGLTDGMTCLEYTFDKNAVIFFFQENALCAVTLFRAN